jgi:hypothetical protein
MELAILAEKVFARRREGKLSAAGIYRQRKGADPTAIKPPPTTDGIYAMRRQARR